MEEKRYDDFMTSESGNWNVALDYSRLKIMKFLYLTDELEILATFGYSEITEEIQTNKSQDSIKIISFQRLIKYLTMLINNTSFAIKKQADKDKFKEWKKELERVYEIIPTLYQVKRNSVTKTKETFVKKDKYEKVLKRVVDIKADINDPLNRNDLIFKYVEEFDPKAYKEQFMEDIKRG